MFVEAGQAFISVRCEVSRVLCFSFTLSRFMACPAHAMSLVRRPDLVAVCRDNEETHHTNRHTASATRDHARCSLALACHLM